jgi:toxin-antitoxin system PIN domain toxin
MILVDANLLLYAYGASSPHHETARRWLEETFSRPEPVRLAWVTILAFLRISTHPRMHGDPFPMAEAAAIVGEWLQQPNVGLLQPGERHWAILNQLLRTFQIRGSLVTDAHLAALAIEHGATLCTNDRDFSRFEGLRVEYPLA